MGQQRPSVAIARGLFQVITGPVKRRLDRRYLSRDEAALAIAGIHERLVDVRQNLRDQRSDQRTALTTANLRLSSIESQLSDVSSLLQTSVQRISDLDRELRERIDGVGSQAAIGAAFVGREEPHELRKKLFDAHRLARESAEAIESLLQAELELWQAVDGVDAERSRPGLTDA